MAALRLAFLMVVAILKEAHAQDASTTLTQIMTDYWDWRLRTFPQLATYRGVHDYDDRLDEYTLEAFDAQQEAGRGFLERANQIDESALSSKDKENMMVLKTELTQIVEGYKFSRFGKLTPISFMAGPHRSSGWVSQAKFDTLEDFQKYERRLLALPTQFNQIKDLMREAIRLRRTSHEVSMIPVPDQIDAAIRPLNTSDFYMPYREKLQNSSVPEELRQNLTDRGASLVQNVVHPAFLSLKDFVQNEYMNHTRTGYGVGSLEFGQDYYKACLKFHLSTDITPEEIHQTGLREVQRISAEMKKIMENQGFSGGIREFVEHLENNERAKYYDKTAEWLLNGYRTIIADAHPKLTQITTLKEDAPCKVEPRQFDGPSGSYGSNTFWVNVFRPHTRPTYLMKALTLHEASPGHHMQISIARQQSTPDFRRLVSSGSHTDAPATFPGYTAFVEGWALYAEYLGEEMDVYNRSALEMFGRYSSEIFRACRLVVDTGLHSMGKSKQWAEEYMANFTAMPTQQITTEVNRYITYPGQACAYKFGELDLKRMRRKAEQALGDKFDIRYFHDAILKAGRSPLTVIERAVDAYISENTDSGPESDAAGLKSGLFVIFSTIVLRYYL